MREITINSVAAHAVIPCLFRPVFCVFVFLPRFTAANSLLQPSWVGVQAGGAVLGYPRQQGAGSHRTWAFGRLGIHRKQVKRYTRPSGTYCRERYTRQTIGRYTVRNVTWYTLSSVTRQKVLPATGAHHEAIPRYQ